MKKNRPKAYFPKNPLFLANIQKSFFINSLYLQVYGSSI